MTRSRQARKALTEALPRWWPNGRPGEISRSLGPMEAIMEVTPTTWHCRVLFRGVVVGSYSASSDPYIAPDGTPEDVIRCAIGEARQNLEVALATLPKVDP